MVYDLSKEDQVDLVFECTPTVDLYSQRFVTMMWASYMHCTYDRKIHLGYGGRPNGLGCIR